MGNQPQGADHGGTSPNRPLSGRSSTPGPNSGGYFPINFGIDQAAAVGTITLTAQMPMAARLISANVFSVAMTAVTWRVRNAGVDVIAAVAMPAAGQMGVINATSSPALVAAQRNFAKGATLELQVIVTTALTDCNITLWFASRGHINADSAND